MTPGFICYDSYLSRTSRLSDEEVGRLFRALMNYHISGETPELVGMESIAFDFIREDLDSGDEKYQARCETNRRNRMAGKSSSTDSGGDIAEKSRPAKAMRFADDTTKGIARSKTQKEEAMLSENDDRSPLSTIVNDRNKKKMEKKKEFEKENQNTVSPEGPLAGTAEETSARSSGYGRMASESPLAGTAEETVGDGFEEFYAAFPVHVSRQDAIRAWNQIRPDLNLRQIIMDALAKQKNCDQWTRDNGRYIPSPANWLWGRRWEDEPRRRPVPQKANPALQYDQRSYAGTEESLDEALARWKRESGLPV